MFGANAPASIWHMTFDHANLGPASYFALVPGNSPFNGQAVKQNKGNTGGGNVSGSPAPRSLMTAGCGGLSPSLVTREPRAV
jgi:hypothetical protein